MVRSNRLLPVWRRTVGSAPTVLLSRGKVRYLKPLRIIVAVLCFLGIYAAVERLAVTMTWRSGELSAYDLAKFDMILNAEGITPGSREEAGVIAYATNVWHKFPAHRAVTFAHLIAGIFLLAVAPLQFSPRFRARSLRRHRILGRMLLVAGMAPALSSLYFGTLSNAVEPSASFFLGAFFLFAAVRGIVAIRRRDIARHRQWMIRMYSVAVSAGTIRAVASLLFFLTPLDFPTALRTSFWVGGLLSIGVAEIYIRTQRHDQLAPQSAPAA